MVNHLSPILTNIEVIETCALDPNLSDRAKATLIDIEHAELRHAAEVLIGSAKIFHEQVTKSATGLAILKGPKL